MRLAVAREDAQHPAEVVLDGAQRIQGRGAYLCRAPEQAGPSLDCLRLAKRRNGLARTLRSRVPMSRELVESLAGA